MEALKVFSSVIGYLKDNMRKESTQIKDCDITMVLTAPVILNDTVKQFMRGAAEKVELSCVCVCVCEFLYNIYIFKRGEFVSMFQ